MNGCYFLVTMNNVAYEHVCTKFCLDLYVIFSLQWGFEAKFCLFVVPSTTNLYALKHVSFILRRMVAGSVSVFPYVLSDLFFIFLHTDTPNIQQMCLC